MIICYSPAVYPVLNVSFHTVCSAPQDELLHHRPGQQQLLWLYRISWSCDIHYSQTSALRGLTNKFSISVLHLQWTKCSKSYSLSSICFWLGSSSHSIFPTNQNHFICFSIASLLFALSKCSSIDHCNLILFLTNDTMNISKDFQLE